MSRRRTVCDPNVKHSGKCGPVFNYQGDEINGVCNCGCDEVTDCANYALGDFVWEKNMEEERGPSRRSYSRPRDMGPSF